MTFKSDIHEELFSLYRRTGEATGYWPNYFRRSVLRDGGLAVAKKLLAPGSVSAGFGRLVEARRADLSVEAIAVSDRFSHLFSAEELQVARRRLDSLPATAFPKGASFANTHGDEEETNDYLEGSVKRVTVNAYERRASARNACLRAHGHKCAVCGLDFEVRYGKLGKGFIHVHHKRPLGGLKASYRLNPKRDLVPVCPNCHAMLHRRTPPLDVEQLRVLLVEQAS
jgi:5-methylcytosine-specific restriction enzyme A